MSWLEEAMRQRRWFTLAAGAFVIDQISKAWIHAVLPGEPKVELIPGWLNLVYSRNPGGLFGFFSDLGSPWRLLLLTALPIAAIVLITHFLVRADDGDRMARPALALILGGALGNLIDRLFRGEVIDFIDVQASGRLGDWLVDTVGTAHWHTFNIADSCIVCGAILLLASTFRSPARQAVDS